MRNRENSTTRPHAGQRAYRPRYGKSKNTNGLLRRIIFIELIVLCCVCAVGLSAIFIMLVREHRQLDELADIVAQNTQSTATGESNLATTPSQPANPETTPSLPAVPTILPQYAELYEKNPDMFGWIQIENTRINYPVMHTPQDPERYLHANFDGKYSYGGLLFMDGKCTSSSDNLIIYGHNMIDGSMFRDLMKYKDQQFWEEHPIIKLDTLYEECEYEVMSVFYDRIYYSNENVFKFYRFINTDNEADYNYAISQIKNKQLYNTNVNAVYGDQLITLVTCSYHTENGRFVVVARKVS